MKSNKHISNVKIIWPRSRRKKNLVNQSPRNQGFSYLRMNITMSSKQFTEMALHTTPIWTLEDTPSSPTPCDNECSHRLCTDITRKMNIKEIKLLESKPEKMALELQTTWADLHSQRKGKLITQWLLLWRTHRSSMRSFKTNTAMLLFTKTSHCHF